LTLDHSHCQCPSLFDCFGKPCPLTCACGVPKRPCFQITSDWKHRKARTLARIRTIQKTRVTFNNPGHIRCHRRVRTLPYMTSAPALIRHGFLRPASRDLSGDARSGNANRIPLWSKQASNIRQSFPTGCPIKRPYPHPVSGRLGC